jgi:trehalose-6-phosphate synthase
LRDGMNLVAKEYVASRVDDGGALILSEFAGAAIELKQAHIVNPHDIESLKSAILSASQTLHRDTVRRMRALRRRVFQHDVVAWADSFMRALEENYLIDATVADVESETSEARR